MQFIILDIEATCWNDSFSPYPQETIELGACKLSMYGKLLSKFSELIIPRNNPILSQYCRNLTGISQKEIDQAKNFNTVMSKFEDWVFEDSDQNYYFAWGSKDKKILADDNVNHRGDNYWIEEIQDLKKQYNDIKAYNKVLGFDKVLELENIEFEGNKHRALPDAFNLAKVFVKYIDSWQY